MGFYLPVGIDLRLNSPSAICILSHLLLCALKPSQGAQEHVLFLKLKDKCATQGAPSIVSDGVTCHGRLMIRLCDGELEHVWTGLGDRGCPRSLFTIDLRWSSCRLGFLISHTVLALSTCSVELQPVGTDSCRACLSACVSVVSFLCQTRSVSTKHSVVFSGSPTPWIHTWLWKYSTVTYKCCFVRTKREV